MPQTQMSCGCEKRDNGQTLFPSLSLRLSGPTDRQSVTLTRSAVCSMAKLKPPTAQDLYRRRRQREEEEKYAHLPWLGRSWEFVLHELCFKACVSHFNLAFGHLTYYSYVLVGRCSEAFSQQDAHEFLRIILDAMRMEEQDIIKSINRLPRNDVGRH